MIDATNLRLLFRHSRTPYFQLCALVRFVCVVVVMSVVFEC